MTRGGKRTGAGRPAGSGKYRLPTTTMRVPTQLTTEIDIFIAEQLQEPKSIGYLLPLYSSKVQAGFPSPAEDYIEGMLDLNAHLIKHPAATFVVRVKGDSMIQAGIFPNDLLIVDRSLMPVEGKIVIAVVEGELTVKRLARRRGQLFLDPENPAYRPIVVKGELHVWGVVTNVIHAL